MVAAQNRSRVSAARARSRVRFVAGIALAALAVVSLLRWTEQRRALRASHPPQEGTLVVAGIEAPITLLRDRRGVPHVRASSEHDAWFALGFAHAQDRLSQMLWLRRVAAGRTAELVGEEGLASDREARTLDLVGLAQRDVARQAPVVRRALEAYAAGVNARLSRLRSREEGAPLALLEPISAVDPWAPADSLALVKLMAWSYGSGLDEMIVLEQIVRVLGATAARPFFPRGVGSEAVGPEPEPAPAPALPVAPAPAPRRRPSAAVPSALRARSLPCGTPAGRVRRSAAPPGWWRERSPRAGGRCWPPTPISSRASLRISTRWTSPAVGSAWQARRCRAFPCSGRVSTRESRGPRRPRPLSWRTCSRRRSTRPGPDRYAEGNAWRKLEQRPYEILQRDGEPSTASCVPPPAAPWSMPSCRVPTGRSRCVGRARCRGAGSKACWGWRARAMPRSCSRRSRCT